MESDPSSETEENYNNLIESDFSYVNIDKLNSSKNSRENVTISLGTPTVNNGSLRNFVTYPISGSDSTGNIQTSRRYKDFKALRDILSRQWPGCYMPQIPPKQMTGNLGKDFIDKRKVLLEAFLMKIAKIPYIYHSEIVQQFVRGPQEFHKCVGHYGRLPFQKLAPLYKEVFSEFTSFVSNSESHKEMEDAQKHFSGCLAQLQVFEGWCKYTTDYFEYYQKEVQNLFIDLKSVNQVYAEEKNINLETRNLTTNPYSVLLGWVRTEILDLEGLNEAIQGRFMLEAIKLKIADRIDEERENLIKIQSGKKNFVQILLQKNKEQYIEKTSREITNLEEELKCVEKIVNIVTGTLLNGVIPKFKEGKQHMYEIVLKTFTSSSIKELEFLIAQNKQIERDILN
ncbi:unnamed protein product [Blepharisma stoltei]|uniref:PX domain-containing protein n=1 Tax=Blepharisma stoltei TaxID=1481888 RepID=A0AAU9J402_9CILI|nr:unnamed protein product [Blepharisma stoltei]